MPTLILMLTFIILITVLASYILSRRHKIFITIDANSHPKLQRTMTIVAVGLLICAAMGLLIVFLLPKTFNFITLIVAVLIIFYFTLTLNKYY